MVRRLPLVLCIAALLVARASRATPHVSDEISLDSPVPSTVPDPAYYEVGAQGAGVWLLTWLDYRDRSVAASLYAARVSADGTILDPGGILLAGHTAGSFNTIGNVAVAFDGTLFLVTWSDTRADSTGADLYAARITTDGRDLDSGGRQLIARPDAQLGPALASNGSQLLVTWTDSRTDASNNIHSSVWAQRVDPATLATVGPAVSVSATPDNTSGSHATWNGVSWVVAFGSWPVASYAPTDVALEIVRINAAGALLDARPHLISAAATLDFNPAGFGLASDGQVTVVAYVEDPSGVDAHLLLARLDSSASPLIPSPVELAHPGVAPADLLGVGFTNGTFVVAWSNPDTSTSTVGGSTVSIPGATTLQSLNADGSVPTPPSAVVLGSNDVQEVVFAPKALLAVREALEVLTYQRYALTGSALDVAPKALDVASNTQEVPCVAWNGQRYYVSWLDERSGPHAYGTLVASDGTVMSPNATPLASAASNQTNLVLAGGSGTFVALWDDDRTSASGQSSKHMLATRIDDTGTVLDTNGIDATTDFFGGEAGSAYLTPTSIVFDGTRFLAGYGVGVQDGSDEGVVSIALDGTVGPVALPRVSGGAIPWGSPNLQIASTGSGSLVEWDWGWQLPSVFVVTSLGASPSDGVPLRPSFDGRSDHYIAVDSIASDGSSYLLAFRDFPNSAFPPGELYLWRFDASGAPTSAMPTRVAMGLTSSPNARLVFDGSEYLLVWTRAAATDQGDVVALQVGRDGRPLTADPFVIAGTPWNEIEPSVASDGAGHVLVAYSRFDPSPTFGSTRVRARLVDLTNQSTDGGAAKPDARNDASADAPGGRGCNVAPANDVPGTWIASLAVALVMVSRRRGRHPRGAAGWA